MNLEINLKEKINEKQNAYPSVGGSLPLGAIGYFKQSLVLRRQV